MDFYSIEFYLDQLLVRLFKGKCVQQFQDRSMS